MDARRWMLFVDGENFVARAQALMKDKGIALTGGSHYYKDAFVWMPDMPPTSSRLAQPRQGPPLEKFSIRSHYYTSVLGDPDRLTEVRTSLRLLGFQPVVFKRCKNQRQSKGVDITMTKDMLVHAFNNNYDAAVLLAGDGDYVPVVDELKRMGKSVYVVFFDHDGGGLNMELRLACDKFFKLTTAFIHCWTGTGSSPDEDVVQQMTRG